ncbi:MAG: 2-oxoacid:acceptor oxidoreductase family protein [candidate division WOR-3 bacterium]|nr:2-oxoacid:acceptor oxidoreductase family protein [candidate division WOR-3 bacterium]MCX7836586.1 2-oxoacid:acceptor oxidoreductase family protein [candidate division WOR-3 bacterium]MDW8114162.1 2-oxoacid:acceptor oxidoreductase family protein [candidate division WOR-3 bacterium]
MEKEVLEIRWHGRGGQGAKTAALLFGEAALETGKYIQAFPEYGPERMGAPVTAYNRISSSEIRIHSGIKNPDILVILDTTLFYACNVLDGLKEDGIILVNTRESPEKIREKLNLKESKIKIYTVDASKIAMECFGRDIPNTPMLGALVKILGIFDFQNFLTSVEKRLEEKFRGKETFIDKNLEAIKRAYEEVKSE